MTIIQIAKSAASDGAQVFKPREDNPGEYDAKSITLGNHEGWFVMDSVTGSAIIEVWDGLNEEEREKYAKLDPVSMAKVAFQLQY